MVRKYASILALTAAIAGCADGTDGDAEGAGGNGAGGNGAGGDGAGGDGAGGDGAGGSGLVTCGETRELAGAITADTALAATVCWELTDHVFVKAGATLTIEAGTVLRGRAGSSLVVTRGAKLVAEGTQDRPIVFTSSKAVGDRKRGDWGGLVLLGRAPINAPGGTNSMEGFPASAGEDVEYGGDAADDDSGTLRYVRVEFAGFELAPDNELNGLSLGGVGAGTTLDFVQVHMGADDGIEFFGGTVGGKHLVVSFADDDGLDWDLGFRGKLQHVVVVQETNAGDNGIEADNNEDDHDAAPRSEPTLWNVTLVGSGAGKGGAVEAQRAATFRRGTGVHLHNALVTRFADFALDVRDDACVALVGDALRVEGSLFFDNAGSAGFDNGDADDAGKDGGFDEHAAFEATGGNRGGVDPGLANPGDLDAPDFTPAAGSAVFTGGGTPPDDGFFDRDATHVGAVGRQNWLAGWTAFAAD